MLPALWEAAGAAFLPCTLVLVLPGLAAVLLSARRSAPALAGFAGAALVVGWSQATGLAAGVTALGDSVLGAIVLVASAVAAVLRPGPGVAAVAGVGCGAVAGAVWQPCVGAELGAILSLAAAEPWAQLPGFAAYLVGLLLPLVAVAAVPAMGSRLARWSAVPAVQVAGAVIAVAVALPLFFGRADAVVGTLLRWSV